MKEEKKLEKKRISRPLVKKVIPFLHGRPSRESIIEDDDLLNLSIALNTCKSTEEFINYI